MKFDIRTCNSAYYFILDFMRMTPDEYIDELVVESHNNFELFWRRNFKRIKEVDITDLKLMAFHVLGSLDDCNEIKENGLKNLQLVLSEDTMLSRVLAEYNIRINIYSKELIYEGMRYDINFENYNDRQIIDEEDEAMMGIAERVFNDFCVDVFFLNDDIYNYGGRVHRRPEFLSTLAKAFPAAEKIEKYWQENSTSYRVDFYATIDQLHRFCFQLDEQRDPPYEGWSELDDTMKIKKWMLSHAIDRSFDRLFEKYIYIKDNIRIPPNQILSCVRI